MDDGLVVDGVDGRQDAGLEIRLGGDAERAKPGAGELGEEAYDDELRPALDLFGYAESTSSGIGSPSD